MVSSYWLIILTIGDVTTDWVLGVIGFVCIHVCVDGGHVCIVVGYVCVCASVCICACSWEGQRPLTTFHIGVE